jgi:methylation protein EvaC
MFIFEDPSLAEVINNNSYDQIYDEHPHVFSVIALDNLLRRNGLQITRVENLSVHGGSNRIHAMKIGKGIIHESVENNKAYERILGLDKFETFKGFAQRVKQSKKDLIKLLTQCKKENKKVISYGATSKSTTIFNYCGIGPDLIEYITDTTPEKQHKLSPGVHIPIIPPEDGFDNSVDYAYLGAWNFIEEISKKEKDFVDRGGKFITHVPIVKFI